jgi:hypothetical protein
MVAPIGSVRGRSATRGTKRYQEHARRGGQTCFHQLIRLVSDSCYLDLKVRDVGCRVDLRQLQGDSRFEVGIVTLIGLAHAAVIAGAGAAVTRGPTGYRGDRALARRRVTRIGGAAIIVANHLCSLARTV